MATQEQLDQLKSYDITVLIDASGSMKDPVKAGSTISRWNAVQETAVSICRDLDQIDSDGIDLIVFGGSNIQHFANVNADKVKHIFAERNPSGGTPLDEALKAGLAVAGKSDKKDVLVVFTDGVPDDKDAAANVIKDAANSISNDDELTILFVQVGDDAKAAAYLRSLDDDLKGAKFDIVDAKTQAEAENFSSTAALLLTSIAD